ncbi:MAG: hypothetical protein M3O34_18605 [Chloroflexota bacterium]|nr:hypothetical protein [Chloroflexota bacterium]
MIDQRDEEASDTLYAVDTDWFDQQNLVFAELAQARMCESCLERVGEEVEERYTVFDQKTGRASFDFRRVPYGADPLNVIREDCSKKRNYITPDMPTLEAVFRVLLANGNAPMRLRDIREQLAEWCPGGGCQWLLLPADQLERVIRNDRFYGIRPRDVAAAA